MASQDLNALSYSQNSIISSSVPFRMSPPNMSFSGSTTRENTPIPTQLSRPDNVSNPASQYAPNPARQATEPVPVKVSRELHDPVENGSDLSDKEEIVSTTKEQLRSLTPMETASPGIRERQIEEDSQEGSREMSIYLGENSGTEGDNEREVAVSKVRKSKKRKIDNEAEPVADPKRRTQQNSPTVRQLFRTRKTDDIVDQRRCKFKNEFIEYIHEERQDVEHLVQQNFQRIERKVQETFQRMRQVVWESFQSIEWKFVKDLERVSDL